MSLKVRLTKSVSSASERQRATVAGLGLTKFNSERVLADTPAIRGMVRRVAHLVAVEETTEAPAKRQRAVAAPPKEG
jgi:large subunit ribosomal protein L30